MGRGEGLLDVGGAGAAAAARGRAAVHLLDADGGLQLEAGEGVAERGGGGAVVRRHGTLHRGRGRGRGGAQQQLPVLHGGAVGAAEPGE